MSMTIESKFFNYYAKSPVRRRRLHQPLFVAMLFGLCGCKSDLTITHGSFTPTPPVQGNVMNVDLVVKNIGNSVAKDVKISIFFDVAGSVYAPRSDTLPTITLLPGAETHVPFQWELTPGWGNKNVRLFAEADVGNRIPELNEQNNSFDFGSLFILPATAFNCQNTQFFIPRYQNNVYQCFDIRQSTLANIEGGLSPQTERVLMYGEFAAINTPANLVRLAYRRIAFFDTTQFPIQTSNVGAPPIFDFKDPTNPWNLVCATVYDNKNDLRTDCGVASADACSGGYNISIVEDGINPPPGVRGISKGNINYFYNVMMPADCLPIEFHEFQHIIDRLFLKPHPSWFEEMLARLFANDANLLPLLCPNVQFTDIQKVENGQTQVLASLPSMWEINSTLPLDSFGAFYAGGDPCKEAIILQMNRGALAGGQPYLRKLFRILMTSSIQTNQEIAQAILLAQDNDPTVRAFLRQNGCIQ